MPHSIFNTFSNSSESTVSSYNIASVVEELINDLLNSKQHREEVFKVYNTDNAEKTLKNIVISLINRSRAGIAGNSDEIVRMVLDYFFGYHLIQNLLDNPDVSDVRICAPDDIWYKEKGKSFKAHISFPSEVSLDTFVRSVVVKNGGIITHSKPHFKGGDIRERIRISAKMPPATMEYPFIHFRIHRFLHTTLFEMQNCFGMMDIEILKLLQKCIAARLRIAVVGPSGSGKTTLMRALINEIHGSIPSITIEEIPELYVAKSNNNSVVILNRTGEIDSSMSLSDYTTDSLIEGTDCINIGEIKGPEAFDIGNAYNTGHFGINTFHVRNIEECDSRFAHMAAGNSKAANYTEERLRKMFASSFDLIIYMQNFRIFEICEVDYAAKVVYNPLYRFIPVKKGDKTDGYYKEINPISARLKYEFEIHENTYCMVYPEVV